MSDFRARLMEEYSDLQIKQEKLTDFILSTKFDELAWLRGAVPTQVIGACPVCRRPLDADEVYGSCANTKDGHHRRVRGE